MNLLKKIQRKNRHRMSVQWPEPDTSAFAIPHDMTLADLFKLEVEKVGGHACLCRDREHLVEELTELLATKGWNNIMAFDSWAKELLAKIDLGITISDKIEDKAQAGVGVCEYLVAWTGSVVVSSFLPGGRQFNIFSPDLIIVARKEQLVLTPDQALEKLYAKYREKAPSQITFITGPSKTADIEKTLIYGMHGPRSLYVYIV